MSVPVTSPQPRSAAAPHSALPPAEFASAAAINEALEKLPAVERLRWAAAHFGARAWIGTSFQPAGLVILHLAHRHGLSLQAFTIDTGLLFPETLELKAKWEAILGQPIASVKPILSVNAQAHAIGPELWKSDPDLCCQIRKVDPLHEKLNSLDVWITGLRREQSSTRADSPIAEVLDHSAGAHPRVWKLNPLADWSREQVWTYLREHKLPWNPLHDRGYRSIGCTVCTRPVGQGEQERAGRWVGFQKTECGLHSRAKQPALTTDVPPTGIG